MKDTLRRKFLVCPLVGLLSSLFLGSWASAQEQIDMKGGALAPIWVDGLGEVDPNRYTLEERAQMISAYWTRERMESAV